MDLKDLDHRRLMTPLSFFMIARASVSNTLHQPSTSVSNTLLPCSCSRSYSLVLSRYASQQSSESLLSTD